MDFTKIPSDEKVQAVLTDNILSAINTMLIVKVVKVYASTQRVDVQPCIKVKYADPDSKTNMYTRLGKLTGVSEIELPIILNVPICFPRAGNFMVTLPITVNDTGMLLISQQDLSLWKQQGGSGVSTQHIDQFNINNGVYIPFVPNAANAVSDYSATALELRAGSDKLTMAGDGKITTNCDIIIDGISFLGHKHPANGIMAYASPNVAPLAGTTGSTGVPE
jgi:hypothetical protein